MLVLNNSELKYRNTSNDIFDHGELKKHIRKYSSHLYLDSNCSLRLFPLQPLCARSKSFAVSKL